MKKLIKPGTILSALLIIFLVATAFHIDGVKTADVQIKRGTGKPIKIGCSQKALVGAFGSPTKKADYNFEMDSKTGYALSYGASKFYFEDDKLMGFEIKTDDFNLTFGNLSETTSIGKDAKSLPAGFTTKSSGNNRANVYDLQNDDNSTTDKFLEYDYDASGIISRIIYSNY